MTAIPIVPSSLTTHSSRPSSPSATAQSAPTSSKPADSSAETSSRVPSDGGHDDSSNLTVANKPLGIRGSTSFMDMNISGEEEKPEEEESDADHLRDVDTTLSHLVNTASPTEVAVQESDTKVTMPSFEVVRKTMNGDEDHTSVKLPEPPRSSYYYGPPSEDAAYGSDPIGIIGVHHPREIIRVERDYEHGELCQFSSAYPLELEGRLTPTQFLETINAINEVLISAHSVKKAVRDNTLAILSLYTSTLIWKSHYEKEMERLRRLIEDLNSDMCNARGLHILWPRRNAFLYLEIEFY